MDPFYTVDRDGDFTVVTFQTASLMNAMELERIGQGLSRLVQEQNVGKMVLDFATVEYLSSQAIGIVVSLQRAVAAGGKLVLCGVRPQLAQLLKITRLDRLLTVRNTREEAVA